LPALAAIEVKQLFEKQLFTLFTFKSFNPTEILLHHEKNWYHNFLNAKAGLQTTGFRKLLFKSIFISVVEIFPPPYNGRFRHQAFQLLVLGCE